MEAPVLWQRVNEGVPWHAERKWKAKERGITFGGGNEDLVSTRKAKLTWSPYQSR